MDPNKPDSTTGGGDAEKAMSDPKTIPGAAGKEREAASLDDSLNSTGGASDRAASPLNSSNDSETMSKRQRTRTPSPGRHRAPEPGNNFMVAASPPKFVSMEEIMKTADGVGNMALAHEIAIDDDFQLKKFTPENSLERQVRDIMHRAFWNGLQEKLDEEPPDFSQALALLGEVKESLLDVLLPRHTKVRQHIDEVLDLELIQQQAEHGTLDVYQHAAFIQDIMTKLCAPVRDDRVAAIKEMKDVVPLFKEIFAVLDLMKMDMANFTIQQIRPYIQQQSVAYERKKFTDFIKIQEDNNRDGLQLVKEWLVRHADSLQYEEGNSNKLPVSPPPTPAAILNTAYLELLYWDERKLYPETLAMDQGRLSVLRDRTEQLTLISAVLLVTYSTVGASIAGISSLKNKLKDELLVIMGDTLPKDLGDTVQSICAYVIKAVNECLKEHGFSELDASRALLLKGQIENVVSDDHMVHKLIRSRIKGFVGELVGRTQPVPVKFPPGVSTISEELNVICGQFLRLISHNRNVFGGTYADIVSNLLRRTQSRERTTSGGEETAAS